MADVTISEKKLDMILSTLEALKRDVKIVKEKLRDAPPYGSDEWWEWSMKKSMEDYTQGKCQTFTPDTYLKELDKRIETHGHVSSRNRTIQGRV